MTHTVIPATLLAIASIKDGRGVLRAEAKLTAYDFRERSSAQPSRLCEISETKEGFIGAMVRRRRRQASCLVDELVRQVLSPSGEGGNSMNQRFKGTWGLGEWAAVATILGLIVAVAALYFTVSDRGAAETGPSANPPNPAPSQTSQGSTSAPPDNQSTKPTASSVNVIAPDRSFRIHLERNTGIDVDAGKKSQVFPSSGADIGIGPSGTFDFQGNETTLYPIAGKPSLERCSKAISSSEEEFRWIDLRDVAVGSSMCLATDEGRTAGITVALVRDTDDTDYEDVAITLQGLVWN